MGSGKSTIGRLLAKKKNFYFVDLDDYIEEKEKMTVSEIFESKGEVYFRKKEHLYLKELINSEEDFVLALGGGTPCYAGNMDVINVSKNTDAIYLRTSIATVVERLIKEKEKRPLVARLENDQLPEFVAKHLFERSYFYNKAKYKLTVDNKNANEVVKELSLLLS